MRLVMSRSSTPCEVVGWVTSVGDGHSVGKSIAMGYVDEAVADQYGDGL
jgi:glycine cleavage system aminomethyltransferase T